MIQEPQTQLNDLPEEILLQVFENINFKSLLELSLVCKRWNGIIGQDAAIMKKISLAVYNSHRRVHMYPNKFTRNYQSVKIYGRYEKLEYRLLMALTNGSYLRNLEINCCAVMNEDEENFSKQIASLTKLKTLRISQLSPFDLDLTHLNQLKVLLLDGIDLRIVKFPERAQLTSLYVQSSKIHEFSGLISFLADQKKLEELSIYLSNDSFEKGFFLEKLKAVQFPLKKLSMGLNFKIFGSEENFLLFMKKFVNSLEEIYVQRDFPRSVYEMIFNEFHKLKTLRVHIDYVFREGISIFSENTSIQKLIINDDLGSIKQFFDKLPNLETLDIGEPYFSRELAMFIAGNPSKLKNLRVSRITARTFDKGVNIPWLKKLSITKLNYNNYNKQKYWKKVVRAMPNIEEFEILSFHRDIFLNVKNVKIITEGWLHLKHVTLGHGFVASKEIFNLFQSNCKKLETVEVFEEAFKSSSEKDEILREVKREEFRLRLIIRPRKTNSLGDEYGKFRCHNCFNCHSCFSCSLLTDCF